MIPTRRTTPRTRAGIAMLLVLATLVLATGAVVALTRIATDTRLASADLPRRATADRLLDAAEAPIQDWLQRHAGRVVLPPDSVSPRFTVLDDSFPLAQQPARLVITAFDQCAMPPTVPRSPRTDQHLPDAVRQALGRLGRVYADSPGLDLLGASTARPVFPRPEPGQLALGEQAATHNPPRPGARAAVNINTAPLALIESVYAARGLGGIDAIIESRTAGRIASPGAARATNTDKPDDYAPLPVAMSTAWAFRIDCHAGGLTRSWWDIYADSGSNWERVQRVAIRE
ncbi:MAG: hypothetical protein IT431_12840 [Phycisphaerales bacterium]|nr:hypothetical protein [Phycisphaerales bacterium]